MFIEKLESYGLSEKEAKVYVSLLELGETVIQRISIKSKVKRTTLYDVLESLIKKGLVSTIIKKKRKYYIASDPRELESKLDEKKALIKTIIPELLSISNLIDKKPKIRFYEGEEGIKEIYMDTLNYPDKPLWAWVTDDVFELLDENFLYYYLNQRVKNKITAYVISPDTEEIREYRKEDKKYLRFTKLQKTENFSVEVEIDLYGGNKIGVMSFKEGIGLIIESQKLFNTLKSIFDSNWNNLAK
jgi:HTH-type transcriptional regulator, sugar sensing transcriptional regulator